jgi:pimeloyl-ACP methyl ester carboxylesterase
MSPVHKKSGYFESFDGTRIYYELRGQGKPLVFVYGIACLMNHWHLQTTYFSQNYQTIMFDFRGHHFSDIPKDKKNLSIEALAKDLIALCEYLGIEDGVFLGHSFGTEVILKAYLIKPELFKACCFIGGTFSNPFAHLMSVEKLKEVLLYAKKAYNASPGLMTSFWKWGVTNPVSVFLSAIVGGFNLKQTATKDIEIYAQGVANIDLRVFLTLFEELIEHDYTPDLVKLKAPTLVIAGENDSLTPSHKQVEVTNALPQGDLYLIPAGSHCVQLDFPDLVNPRIDTFLRAIEY